MQTAPREPLLGQVSRGRCRAVIKPHGKLCKAAPFFMVSVLLLVIEVFFLLKPRAFQPLCANEFNTCIDFGAVTPDLRWQMRKARPASCPVILIHLHHLGATS